MQERDLLRSLADLNRRKRFCRPLPSHSAKRPYYTPTSCQAGFLDRCLSASWRTRDPIINQKTQNLWRIIRPDMHRDS
jgi:hypothetical protein